ncbi:putative sugar transporter, partial [Operophtera brumata]
MGWTSPINVKLNDTSTSPLDVIITTDQKLMAVFLIPGPFLGGFLASKVGRKWGLLSTSIPLFVGWILIAAASSVGMIYAGRIFWGLAVGMLFTISPMYCAEIATDDVRGALGSFLQAFITLGFLLVYGIGPFISYSAVAYVGVGFVAVFTISFFFMPESPTYYLTKTDERHQRGAVLHEQHLLCGRLCAGPGHRHHHHRCYSGNKMFYISCALVSFQQMSGINTVLFYMSNIFSAAGFALDPAIATIIIGAIQFYISCALVSFQQMSGINTVLFYMSNIFSAAGFALDPPIATIIIGAIQFYISCALVSFQQMSGINAVLFYMSNIFSAAGSALDPAIATIIIGAIQFYISCALVSFQQVSNIFSATGSALDPAIATIIIGAIQVVASCITPLVGLLGMYFILADNQSPIAEKIGFLPILALVLFIVTYCWGLGPLPWAVMGELFPIEVKALASPIATAYCWGLSFLVTRYFNPIADAIGMGVAFLIFAVFCVISFFFTLF